LHHKPPNNKGGAGGTGIAPKPTGFRTAGSTKMGSGGTTFSKKPTQGGGKLAHEDARGREGARFSGQWAGKQTNPKRHQRGPGPRPLRGNWFSGKGPGGPMSEGCAWVSPLGILGGKLFGGPGGTRGEGSAESRSGAGIAWSSGQGKGSPPGPESSPPKGRGGPPPIFGRGYRQIKVGLM